MVCSVRCSGIASSRFPFIESSSRGLSLPRLKPRRCSLHTSLPRTATYRRFGERSSGTPFGSPTNPNQGSPLQQLLLQYGGGKSSGGPQGFKRKNSRDVAIVCIIAGGGGIYYVCHLERVPATGRLRFIDVDRSMELSIGQQTFEQTMQENRGKILPSHDSRVKFVRSIAERIISALHDSDYSSDHMNTGSIDKMMDNGHGDSKENDDVKWEIFVINSPEKNAFVTSNGKIFVYTGILPICQDQDGLATVLGHEIAHQLARHIAEKLSGTKVLGLGVLALQILGLDVGFSQLGLWLALALPNSRKTEMEADQIGLQLMSKACFDPAKAPLLWERMEKSEGGGGGIFSNAVMAILSTHPLSKKRMKSMQKGLPQAMETRRQAGCPDAQTRDAFQSFSRQSQPPTSRSSFS